MATGSQWKFGADASEYKRVVREMPSEMDKAASKIEGRTKQMSGNMSKFMGQLGIMGAGGVIVGLLTELYRKMDDIADGAKRLGITTTAFQKIGNAADLVGTNVETVAKAMLRAGVAANKAAREGGDMAEAFQRADLDPAKFAAASLEERIRMVAAAQRAANGDAQKMSELFEAIGVKAAGVDFASLADEMANVSAASDDTVQALARANDELDKAKQNATIFGANLLKALMVNPSERLGDLLAGGTGKTIAEQDAQLARDNAIAALKNKGQFLPDDSTTKMVQKFVGGSVPATVPEIVHGPNSQENERRIAAEIKAQEELNRKKQEESDLARQTAQYESEQKSNTEKKAAADAEAAKFKQYILELELQIKEAQNAGDKDREESLTRLKDWTEASIKYEGDLDAAARDVNATYAERVRLQEQALQKTIAQTEKEVQLAEAMAYGTDEEKKKAQWMQKYQDVFDKTRRDDLARRAANADTYEAPRASSGSSSGTASSSASAVQPEASFEQKVAEMRAGARSASSLQQAAILQQRGLFRSAQRILDREQRAKARFAESALVKDTAARLYFGPDKTSDARNLGEAFADFNQFSKIGELRRRMGGDYDRTKSEQENFRNMLLSQAKTDAEKKAAEEQAAQQGGAPGGGKGDTSSPLETMVKDIVKLMQERLPIRVLAA